MPAKKSKEDRTPKWQAKTGKGKPKEIEITELLVVMPASEETTLAQEPTELPVVATTPEAPEVEPTNTGEVATTTDSELATYNLPTADMPVTVDESTPKKSRKLKVQADPKPK